MKINTPLLYAVIVSLCVCICNAVENHVSTVLISLTLTSLNVGVSGFFGFFRRRNRVSPAPVNIPEDVQETAAPQGPVSLPFGQRPGGFFGNPFSYGGGGNQFQSQFPSGFPGSPMQGMNFQQQLAQQMDEQQIPQHMQEQIFQQMQQEQGPEGFDFQPGQSDADMGSPSLNSDEAESFFTLLAETDESQCISRLVCEMGADPMNAGEFGSTVTDIISSLRNFPPGSKVAHYNEIMQIGVQRGLSACASRFSSCDEESLRLVKNAQVADGQGS